MVSRMPGRFVLVVFLAAVTGLTCFAKPKKAPEPIPLTAQGKQYLAEYQAMLTELQTDIKKQLPAIDAAMQDAFLKAHSKEGPQFSKPKKDAKKQKPQQRRDTGIYKQFREQKASLSKAQPILQSLDGFLGSDKLDRELVKCAVLANATPRGLAVYAQQGPAYKARVDKLLADDALMKQMLIAGGAKAGRYGKAMEILEGIRAASKQPQQGILERLALGTALEMAAPELTHYTTIDPVQRYLAYETWHLDGELDPLFKDMTAWECRHIVSDYLTESDLEWLRNMVNNYRPDTVDTVYVRDKYMAINGEIPQTTPQYDEDITRLQAIVCNGGRCGPKAMLGRATTRAFGIPTWGSRVKAHTGMNYWTEHGWTTSLGVAINNSFWNKDKADPMWTTVFQLDQMARKNPTEYLKALRCGWVGDALGQEKINGMVSGTGGFWHALGMNKKRAIATDIYPDYDGKRVPWTEDTYALIKDYKRRPEKGSPLVNVTITDADRRIDVSPTGVITVPAAACVSPQGNTKKILFMNSRLGGLQIHYKRKGVHEDLVYDVEVPKAGTYELSMKVVTVNRGLTMFVTVNGQQPPIEMPLPFSVGMWEQTQPITVRLNKGVNTLAFTRFPADKRGKELPKDQKPVPGGVSIHDFTLTPK